LTAVCFRYVPPDWPGIDESLDLLNQAIMADVQLEGRAFLAGAGICGRFAPRCCAPPHAPDGGHAGALLGPLRGAGPPRAAARAARGGALMREIAGPGLARPAQRARFTLALAAGKGSAAAGRLLNVGGGTSLPGAVARRIDPLVLRKVAAGSSARKALVTGS